MQHVRRFSPVQFACAWLALGPIAALAGNTGFLNDTAIAALSDEDRKLQLEAALQALESTELNASRDWRNPASGASGRIDSFGKFRTDDGLRCRQVTLFARAKGIESQFAFPVCQRTSGEWFIASGMKLTPL